MNRRLFLAATAAGSAGLGALWTGRLIEAQESDSVLTFGDPRILGVLERDTDRILRRVLSDGWNADRLHALATNVSVASLSMDDRLLERRMEQEIAEMGGEGAALAHLVVDRHLARELQELGFEDSLPYYSMDELREALTELREKGWSRIMADASAGMLQSAEEIAFRDTLRMLGEGGGDGEDNENVSGVANGRKGIIIGLRQRQCSLVPSWDRWPARSPWLSRCGLFFICSPCVSAAIECRQRERREGWRPSRRCWLRVGLWFGMRRGQDPAHSFT